MAGIELKKIQKTYPVDGRILSVLKEINLQIPEKSITVILGRSGCGKTTLLRLVGGLEAPDSGEIHFGTDHKT
ncbi:MAG: ATP-binding cassette domain-containing protein, partial [Anaerotignum sp.]